MPDPLHPAVVHFPLALAVLAPFLAIPLAVLILRGTVPARAWLAASLVFVLLAGSAWAAVETGEDQEEAVEEVVSGRVIHEHEEAAEALLVGAGILAALSLLGLASGRLGGVARAGAALASVAVLVLAVRTGGSGGELVYEHGAAAVYVTGTDASVTGDRRPERESREHDDDRDERR